MMKTYYGTIYFQREPTAGSRPAYPEDFLTGRSFIMDEEAANKWIKLLASKGLNPLPRCALRVVAVTPKVQGVSMLRVGGYGETVEADNKSGIFNHEWVEFSLDMRHVSKPPTPDLSNFVFR